MKMDKKRFIIYMIFAFGLAWVVQVIASVFARKGNITAFQLILSVCMFMPFIAVLIAGVPIKEMGWKPKFKGNIRWILIAWLAPSLLTVLGGVIYYLIFPNRMDFTGSYLISQYGEEMFAQLQSAGITMPIMLVVSIFQAASYAPIINCIPALGEEVGWRGVMYPMLKDKFGRVKGMVIGGIIWGAWHWPVMILAGYEYGLEYWGAPILGMILFCLYATVAGIILDVLYEKTKCIWVPAIGHGAINAVASAPLLVLSAGYVNQMTVGPSPIGIVSMIPFILLAVVLLVCSNK